MATNDKEIIRIIKALEANEFLQKFPRDLRAYLFDNYGEDPWPHCLTEVDLYYGIFEDAKAYFHGKLDVTITPPLDKAKAEIQELRSMYCEAMCDRRDLKDYIDELHEILWANGLSGSRMSPWESGLRRATHADHIALHPEEYNY